MPHANNYSKDIMNYLKSKVDRITYTIASFYFLNNYSFKDIQNELNLSYNKILNRILVIKQIVNQF